MSPRIDREGIERAVTEQIADYRSAGSGGHMSEQPTPREARYVCNRDASHRISTANYIGAMCPTCLALYGECSVARVPVVSEAPQ